MKKEKLFNEFPPVTTQQWEDVIKADLKGADYEKKLVWKTNEGIKVKPYYRSEDLQNLPHLKTRLGKTQDNSWEIRQDVKVYNAAQANAEALEAVEKGATALGFITCDTKLSKAEFTALLDKIHFGCINLNLIAKGYAPEQFDFIVDEAKKRGYDLNKMEGSINFEPLGILSTSGKWNESEEADFKQVKTLIEKAKTTLPKYKIIGVSGCIFQEAGATAVQELGYSLSKAAEYLTRLTEAGLNIDDIAPRIQFNFSTSSNYFMEIAKIRAFRLLWAKLVEAYGAKSEASSHAFIHSTTARWNMTVYDPYVNMLRATTESMSAVLGGADSLAVKSFNDTFQKANSFSNRIARNTQIILKEEAYFDRIVDPAAGSYYIESLTNSIVEEAWKLFLKVDAEGGFSAAFKKGTIQTDIEAVAAKRLNDISTRRETLLGTNQYPNFNEQVLKNIDAEILNINGGCGCKCEGSEIKPLKKMRIAQEIEALRLKTEKSGRRPKVFMLTIGNLAMRLARSQFSSNFFGVAGFEVIDNNGFKTIEDGVKAAVAAKADIIVLCSSDDEYATLAPEAFDKIGKQAIFVVAGAPACMDELKAKGIQNFINVKSNVLETLKGYQSLLSIN